MRGQMVELCGRESDGGQWTISNKYPVNTGVAELSVGYSKLNVMSGKFTCRNHH